MKMTFRKSQISMEYMIIMGFLTFIVVGLLGVAMFYGGAIKDRIKLTQMENCANKVISSAESVYYAGNPSQATITCYLPEGISGATIYPDAVSFTLQTSSGKTVTEFPSNVPINGTIMAVQGLRKMLIKAEEDKVQINPA